MKPSDIWGATDHTWALPEPEVTLDGIDCSHMTAEEAFKAGMDAGKRSIVKEFDDYFTDPKRGAKLSTAQIRECLGCTAKELDALVVDDLDFFGMDRLPQMYQTFRRHTAIVDR
ncbi:hypothetical protein CNR34_00150 [Pseudomonas phage nickie]|uniref:Uncharacterized protein n=1 Tax=Pseudomonas phage nickie TaxID=2048977 RepID=A0A2H4P7B1_9CAUD|nr:hypothetical protein FDJ16_gp015 [Pseudomonas phage nickie]ATW58083.1 hypothetical protein CNR34_00150 [Pseudomonas phage nickie]